MATYASAYTKEIVHIPCSFLQLNNGFNIEQMTQVTQKV